MITIVRFLRSFWVGITAFIITVVFFCGSGYPAHAPEEFFDSATSYFEKKDYDDAIKQYEALISSGCISGNIFYNLGNAYFKNGQIGKAILSYERAMLLIPGDSDLAVNLRYVKSLMKQSDPMGQTSPWAVVFRKALMYNTLGEYFCIISFVYVIVAVLLTWILITRRRNPMAMSFLTLTVGLIVLLLSVTGSKIYHLERCGIVLQEITDARYEPRENSETNFPLFEGMKVYVLREERHWVRIKRTDGRIGWIKSGDIERLSSIFLGT